MTKKTVCQCDICGSEEQSMIIGLLFVVSNQRFEECDAKDERAYKHICFRCVAQIKKINLREKKLILEDQIRGLTTEIHKLEQERNFLLGRD